MQFGRKKQNVLFFSVSLYIKISWFWKLKKDRPKRHRLSTQPRIFKEKIFGLKQAATGAAISQTLLTPNGDGQKDTHHNFSLRDGQERYQRNNHELPPRDPLSLIF